MIADDSELPVAPIGSGRITIRPSTSRPIFASCQAVPVTRPASSVVLLMNK
ncbi:MAG: hypothetical protein NVSMB47_08430 [Polyangiales bacterium]